MCPEIVAKTQLQGEIVRSASFPDILEEVQTWIQKEENASSLLMRVLGDDIVNDLMNELGDPVAMWNVLEST
jgi:hypothetical protein